LTLGPATTHRDKSCVCSMLWTTPIVIATSASGMAVRIVFGEIAQTEVSFHTVVAMARANAEGLAKAIV